MQRLSSCFLFSVFCVLVVACAPKEQTITLIATNDIHAAIDPFPRLATLVEAERAANPGRVILLDAGDRWSGNPYVDMAPEGGRPIIELMDSLGYDIATLGNHEFDFGQELLQARLDEMSFPVVLANLKANGQIGQPASHRVMEVGGVKIAVLGLVNTLNGGYPAGLPEHFGAMEFAEPLACALEYRSLRDSADVLVLLSHLGYSSDTLLAHRMPELDLIVGGHSHTVLPRGERIAGTLVTQGGNKLRYASVTTLRLRGKKLTGIENRLVSLDTIAPDPRFEAMVAAYKDRPELTAVVGEVTAGMGKTALLNLAADMIRSRVSADLGLYNRGGVRLDTLAPGGVSVAQVYTMEPFGNTIQTIEMSLEELRTFLLNSRNEPGGERVNPSGFTYTMTIDPATDKATDVELRLQRTTPSGRYRVAAPDYVFKNFPFAGRGEGRESGIRIASAMEAFLDKHSPYTGDDAIRVEVK